MWQSYSLLTLYFLSFLIIVPEIAWEKARKRYLDIICTLMIYNIYVCLLHIIETSYIHILSSVEWIFICLFFTLFVKRVCKIYTDLTVRPYIYRRFTIISCIYFLIYCTSFVVVAYYTQEMNFRLIMITLAIPYIMYVTTHGFTIANHIFVCCLDTQLIKKVKFRMNIVKLYMWVVILKFMWNLAFITIGNGTSSYDMNLYESIYLSYRIIVDIAPMIYFTIYRYSRYFAS